jgi:FkbM family methyltransferase
LDLLLLALLTGNHEKYCYLAYDSEQYFCLPPYTNGFNECFIDAGAYVGDTLERFIQKVAGNFKHIYCFEPGKKQFRALKKRCDRLVQEWALNEKNITLVNAAIGEKKKNIYNNNFNDISLASTSLLSDKESREIIQVYSIDDYFDSIPVSFIKFDIEGYETRTLRGASKTIIKNKPELALCTYHGAEDIFIFIEFISSLVPEYKFSLRHHSFSILETVLYCYID